MSIKKLTPQTDKPHMENKQEVKAEQQLQYSGFTCTQVQVTSLI